MPQNIMDSPDTSTLNMSNTPGENHADGEKASVGFNCKGNYNPTSESVTRNDSSTIPPTKDGSSILDADRKIKKSDTECDSASNSLSIDNPLNSNVNNDLENENMDFSELEDGAIDHKNEQLNADSLLENNSIPSEEKNQLPMEVDEQDKEDLIENHSDVDEILDKLSKEDELGKVSIKESADKEANNEGAADRGEYDEEYYKEGAEGEYEEGEEGEYYEEGDYYEEGEYEEGEEGEYPEEGAEGEYLEGAEGEFEEGAEGDKIGEKDSPKESEKDTKKGGEKVIEIGSKKDVEKSADKATDEGSEKITDEDSEKIADEDSEKISDEDFEKVTDDLEKVSDGDLESVADGDLENIADGDLETIADGDFEKTADEDLEKGTDEDSKKDADKDSEKVLDEDSKEVADEDSKKVADEDSKKVADEDSKMVADKDSEKGTDGKSEKAKVDDNDLEKDPVESMKKSIVEGLGKETEKYLEMKEGDKAVENELKKVSGNVLSEGVKDSLELRDKVDEEDLVDEAREDGDDDMLDEDAENELLGESDLVELADGKSVVKSTVDESLEKAAKDATEHQNLEKTLIDEELTPMKDHEKTVSDESFESSSKDKDTKDEEQMDTDDNGKESIMVISDIASQAEDMETSTQYDKLEEVSSDPEMPDLIKSKESMEESLEKLKNKSAQVDEEAPELEMNEEGVKNDEVVLDDSDDDFDPISLLAVEHSTPDEPNDSDFQNNLGISNDDESRPSSVAKTPVNDHDLQSEISEITPNGSDAEEESVDLIKVKESDKDIDRVVKKKLEEILTKTICQVDGIPEHFLLSTNRRKKLGFVKEGTVEEVVDKLVSKVSSHVKKMNKESAKLKSKEQNQPQDKDENDQNWDNQDNQKGYKNCTECGSNKGLRYQVLFHGRTCFLCSDHCFQVFRSKQNLAPPPPGLTPRPMENCSVCKVEIKNGQGYFPLDTDGKSVCSEECIRQYQQMHGAKQTCAQCKKGIEGRTKCLSWETMEFCNEDCLGKYQQFLGSYCACCKQAVQRLSLGKYCVRFGSDIRQFCSGKCLEEFKRGLKVCTFCQKDLTGCTDGFLAPVGNKGLFKDFCSQQCLSQYETMNSAAGAAPKTKKCSVCQKVAPIKAQVTFNNQEHTLCSDPCVAAFRYANKITNKICDTCHKFFKSESSPLQFEGASKRFCTKTCMNLFVLSHRKIVPCTWCKVKKYNFDMIERVDSNNHVQLFCSLNCLSLFRVSLNATSSRSIRCDHCRNNLPAQYHLTMSDASIRNFCTYQCVIQFQSQFTSVPTLTTVTPTARNQPVPGVVKNVATAQPIASTLNRPVALSNAPSVNRPVALSNATPVISSVISLAPTNIGPVRTTQTTIQNVNTISTAVGTNFMPQNAQVNFAPYMNKVQSVQAAPPAAPSQPPQVQVIRELVVKPAPVKVTKNKMISCKPSMQTKGVACKPHPCHKCTQTDEPEPPPPTYVPIPIPVPVFIPVPMHMYTRTVPCPTPFPIPIPVPVFIPTTKNNTEQILQTLKEIRERTPDNPFEAELLMMAEMVASQDQPEENETQNNIMPSLDACNNDYDGLASVSLGGSSGENSLAHDYVEFTEPMLDLETALATPSFDPPSLIAEDPQVFLSSLGDESSSDLTPREQRMRQRNTNSSSKRRNSGRGRSRGKKRARLSESAHGSEDSNEPYISGTDTSFSEPIQRQAAGLGDGSQAPDANLCLKYMFGVNAWKHWVIQKNNQLERGSQSRRLKLFKPDLLQLSADELNYSLCLFVKEVRKPNGEEYAPDSIYYLCLGIQMYIFENGRVDNIFTDGYYEKFTECLNDVVQKQEMAIMREGRYISRIEEEILWESKQLGAHSPHVLLNTLMYFNTKHFGLRNVDDHANLSFSHIIKHYKKDLAPPEGAKVLPSAPGKLAILKYYPPTKELKLRVGKKEEVVYEQIENLNNVLRCPVKLYEFYLSKCPDSIRTRSDVFYLYPERSCVPDSPVWYSMQPLGRETLSKMLHRIRLVREINRPNLCD